MPLNTIQTPFQEKLHGVTVRDPYRWLENRNLSATEEWIQAQQRQYAAYFYADPDFDRLAGIVSGYLNIEVIDQPVRVHMARNGVTVRPLNDSSLRLKTCLVCRADDDSKIASEFVRAYMRKMPDKKRHQQLPLPISA